MQLNFGVRRQSEAATPHSKSPSSVRNLFCFRQSSQSQHCQNPKYRAWRQERKNVSPANQINEPRNQLYRYGRQQKSQTRLNRQGRPDVLLIAQFSHTGRELR